MDYTNSFVTSPPVLKVCDHPIKLFTIRSTQCPHALGLGLKVGAEAIAGVTADQPADLEAGILINLINQFN